MKNSGIFSKSGIRVIENFKWKDWVDLSKTMPNPHKRADIRLKDYPYRGKPVEGPK